MLWNLLVISSMAYVVVAFFDGPRWQAAFLVSLVSTAVHEFYIYLVNGILDGLIAVYFGIEAGLCLGLNLMIFAIWRWSRRYWGKA